MRRPAAAPAAPAQACDLWLYLICERKQQRWRLTELLYMLQVSCCCKSILEATSIVWCNKKDQHSIRWAMLSRS